MKTILSAVVLIALLSGCAADERPAAASGQSAPPPPPAPAATSTEAAATPANHDVTGAYFPIDPLPQQFAEIEHLSLATIDENGASAPLNGFLRPKAREAKDYVLDKPALAGKRLTFETTAVGGVRYAFEGEFTQLANFPENPPGSDTVVLAGTLRRIRDGQAAASTAVRFRYEAGG